MITDQLTIWDALDAAFGNHPGHASLTKPDETVLTYGELHSLVKHRAAELNKRYPERSVLCIYRSQPYDEAIDILAVLAAGHVAVPVSSKYGQDRLQKILKDCMPHGVLVDNGLDEQDFVQPRAERPAAVTLSEDAAFILYTSGTTGRPKGVILTQRNILSNLMDIEDYFPVKDSDHILIFRPLSHASAITGEFLHGLLHSARITFYNDVQFSPFKLIAMLNQFQCTVFCTTPTVMYHLSGIKRRAVLHTVRVVAISGERLLKPVIDEISSVFPGIDFYNVYGLTEASPRISFLAPSRFYEKAGSVGIPLNHVELLIVDEDEWQCDPGEVGELRVRGPNVMKGYWNDDVCTNQKLINGWLITGDLAYIDSEGFLYIVGRKDELIIRAGVNVYPCEIEEAIIENASIMDALVYGEADPKYGESICLIVSCIETMTEQDVMRICLNKLEAYQVPDRIQIVNEIPRNKAGKKDKSKFIEK
ncbi:class I adenylate-forming enzyme family protein [Paenibacillus sp. NPDC058071]|uniref:class I adenylate-forming enzyme family protein n=1 Tax=Paenibacillus sp. NPDC058071 TaxID=3346326 RepID=UPI0036DD7B96